MSTKRGIEVSCPKCEIIYRLWDETLLPIARCGRCYGAVVAPDEAVDSPAWMGMPAPEAGLETASS
jgi:uncharacterized protein (DUF983 family)